MKNKILLFLLLLVPFIGQSQTYDKPGNYGLQWKRGKFDSSFKVPILPDTLRKSVLAGEADMIYVDGSTATPEGFWIIANGKYQFLGGDNTNNTTYGTIYDANSWTNLDTFDANFTGFEIDADDNIEFTSGGTANTDSALFLDYYTLLDKWTMSSKIIINEKSDTSYGFGMGLYSINPESPIDPSGNWVRFNMTTDATQGGKMYFSSSFNYNFDSTDDKLTFDVGDTLQVYMDFNYWDMRMTASIKNLNNDDVVSLSFRFWAGPGMANTNNKTGRFAIIARSGGFTLDSLNINSRTLVGADIGFVGASRVWGMRTTTIDKCWARIVHEYYPNSVMLAGSGDNLLDVEDRMEEFGRLRPKQVILYAGATDNPDSMANRYKRVVSQLQNLGIRTVHLVPNNENFNMTALRDTILAIYPPEDILNAYPQMLACGNACLDPGRTHPNDSGHAIIANVILASKNLTGANNTIDLIRNSFEVACADSVLTEPDTATLLATKYDLTDTTGYSWTIFNGGDTVYYRGAAYGNGVFVMVTRQGTNRIYYSQNGKDWVGVVPPEHNLWEDVTFGNGQFVACARSGTYRIMKSVDGINWMPVQSMSTEVNTIAYGNGVYTVLTNGAAGFYSKDAITWNAPASQPASAAWRDIAYGNGIFVGVGHTTNYVTTTTDGVTWTTRTPADSGQWYGITYGDAGFVAVCYDCSPYRIMSSPDGITWTGNSSYNTYGWIDVTFGNGWYMALAYDGTTSSSRIMRSKDAVNWEIVADAGDSLNAWYPIQYGNGMFIAAGPNNKRMYSGSIKEIQTVTLPVEQILADTFSTSTKSFSTEYSDYTFTGTTTTVTLPLMQAATKGEKFYVKNRGSGNMVINTFAGGNDIYDASAVNTITILPGEARLLISDAVYWNVE